MWLPVCGGGCERELKHQDAEVVRLRDAASSLHPAGLWKFEWSDRFVLGLGFP